MREAASRLTFTMASASVVFRNRGCPHDFVTEPFGTYTSYVDSISNHRVSRRGHAMKGLYVHPRAGAVGHVLNLLVNSRRLAACRRAVLSHLPFAVLESDVTDVIYATWMVDVRKAATFAPAGAQLWQCQGKTPFTILCYRHGHFGPRFAGPLRRVFPSPLQSNWRLYLEQPMPAAPQLATVAFVQNVFSSAVYAASTRLFSDALPSHLAACFELVVDAQTACVRIDPGLGSAPQLAMTLKRGCEPELPPAFRGMFKSWGEAVERLASQEAAVVEVVSAGAVALATISLPVAVERIEPLQLDTRALRCPMLDKMGASSEAFGFLLPKVRFSALSEALLPAQRGDIGLLY